MTAYVTEICPQCGNLIDVCSDPNVDWYPQRDVCYATRAKDITWRMIHKKHGQPEWNDPNPHPIDGWRVGAAQYDLTPDDSFDGALRLSAQESHGEEHEPDNGEQHSPEA